MLPGRCLPVVVAGSLPLITRGRLLVALVRVTPALLGLATLPVLATLCLLATLAVRRRLEPTPSGLVVGSRRGRITRLLLRVARVTLLLSAVGVLVTVRLLRTAVLLLGRVARRVPRVVLTLRRVRLITRRRPGRGRIRTGAVGVVGTGPTLGWAVPTRLARRRRGHATEPTYPPLQPCVASGPHQPPRDRTATVCPGHPGRLVGTGRTAGVTRCF
ncbi:hypothetical protein GCM10020369_65030 [Cryptosporangium minutisporangium]|uniref:Uncharacterized protein n=1 Tax=Cryptosporangium minutisporangium TaxID=113569 RepID=A0ABP6T897_9ACTN